MERLNTISCSEEVQFLGRSAENLDVQINKSSIYLSREKIAGILFCLILLPEAFIYFGISEAGILLHACSLTVLVLSSIFVKENEVRNICKVFLLLPILRLVNFSIPSFSEIPLLYFMFIYAPMVIPLVIIIINQQFTSEKLGLSFKQINIKDGWYYLPASILIGLILGEVEYFTMDTTPLIPDLSFMNIFILLYVAIFVGLIEEIIFRSILQTRLEEFLGVQEGFIFTSLLFGLMYSGSENMYGILYAFFVGLLIGYAFQKTRSLPFIVLIHGFINVFSSGIIPHMGNGFGIF